MAILAGALKDRRHILCEGDFRPSRRIGICAERYCHRHNTQNRMPKPHLGLPLAAGFLREVYHEQCVESSIHAG